MASSNWERYTLHWTSHPRRDRAWYDREIASQSMTAESIAQELDISYVASLGRRVYPKYIEAAHMAGGALCRFATCEYVPNRPLCICADWNHDPLIWEIVQMHNAPPFYHVIGEICQRNAIVDDALNEFILRFSARSRVDALLSRNDGWESLYGGHGLCQAGENGHAAPVWIYGDATEEKSTVHNRVKTYQEMREKLRDANFTVSLKVPPANPPLQRRHEVHNDALARNFVLVSPECEQLRKDYELGVWNGLQTDMDQRTEDDDGSHLTRSHASSALGYFLCVVHKVRSSDQAAARLADQGGRRGIQDIGQAFIESWSKPLRR